MCALTDFNIYKEIIKQEHQGYKYVKLLFPNPVRMPYSIKIIF